VSGRLGRRGCDAREAGWAPALRHWSAPAARRCRPRACPRPDRTRLDIYSAGATWRNWLEPSSIKLREIPAELEAGVPIQEREARRLRSAVPLDRGEYAFIGVAVPARANSARTRARLVRPPLGYPRLWPPRSRTRPGDPKVSERAADAGHQRFLVAE